MNPLNRWIFTQFSLYGFFLENSANLPHFRKNSKTHFAHLYKKIKYKTIYKMRLFANLKTFNKKLIKF
jgi:hypothetical protein